MQSFIILTLFFRCSSKVYLTSSVQMAGEMTSTAKTRGGGQSVCARFLKCTYVGRSSMLKIVFRDAAKGDDRPEDEDGGEELRDEGAKRAFITDIKIRLFRFWPLAMRAREISIYSVCLSDGRTAELGGELATRNAFPLITPFFRQRYSGRRRRNAPFLIKPRRRKSSL